MSNTSGPPSVTPKQHPEAPASMAVRDMASEEPQELGRSQATEAEHDVNSRKVAINASLRSESETPTDVKHTQRPEQEEPLPNGSASMRNARDEDKTNHSNDPVTSVIAPSGSEDDTSDSELSNWEQEEDRLEAKAKNQPAQSRLGPNLPLQNQTTMATTTTAATTTTTTILLAGGTQASALPTQTTQKGPNAAATTLKTLKSRINKAITMYHPTLEAHLHQDAVGQAAVSSEADADAADDAALHRVDSDVIKEHLLRDGDLEREALIGSFLKD